MLVVAIDKLAHAFAEAADQNRGKAPRRRRRMADQKQCIRHAAAERFGEKSIAGAGPSRDLGLGGGACGVKSKTLRRGRRSTSERAGGRAHSLGAPVAEDGEGGDSRRARVQGAFCQRDHLRSQQ
eukprot:Amastigsp_a851756_13.p3 type:complete len:125 gc:universal Amastigsp_a851756_13:761-1135(+)